MLKLKKIQILGFKSFCDRTEVTLPGQGMAVVVGPNGCGKSNILDGVTWVLGEQSAKSLRGGKMEDVIFAGTRDRKPLGMAEVSITLIDPEAYQGGPLLEGPEVVIENELNPDWDEEKLKAERAAEVEEIIADSQPGQVIEGDAPAAPAGGDAAAAEAAAANSEAAPTEAAQSAPGNVVLKIRRRRFQKTPQQGEIVVTRRLFRTGDSEYLLNGRLCRLRDIQDIFMGTGLGPESYAIIGQERIGQLLSSKPHDRRAIIEEAAGITRFKTKKRLAELRLEQAKQNLARVNDIFEEVTRQMGSLKRQAAKAERYGALRDEMRARLKVVLASKVSQMDAEQASLTAQIAGLTGKIDEHSQKIEQLDGEHSTGVERGYGLDAQRKDAETRANQSAVELERAASRQNANQERIADLEARAAAAQAELEQAKQHLQSLTAERDGQRSFLENAAAEAASFREQAQAKQQTMREAASAVSAQEQRAEAGRRQAMQVLSQTGQARNQIAQGEESLASLEREAERLAVESNAARRDLEALGAERGQVSMSFESVTETLRRLESEISGLRAEIATKRNEETEAKRRGDQLRAEQATLTGRRNSLEALIREHSYSTDTVRKLFRSNSLGGGLKPVGTLADFLEVNGQYESVVDEFLRDELNYIVVKSWDAAHEGMRLLKSDVDGRATFLVHPEDSQAKFSFAANAAATGYEQQQGVVRLKDCIRVLDGFGKSLEVILPKLRDGYVTPDSDTARGLALENPNAFFLAPSGECFHNVTVTGGKPSTEGPLALKRELRETQSKLDHVEKELGQAEMTAASLSRTLAELTRSLDGKSEERRNAERESATQSAALRQMDSEAQRLERRLQEWTLQSERNRDARTAKQSFIEQKRDEAARLEEQHAAAEASLVALQQQVEELRQRRDAAQQEAAQVSAELAGLEERRRGAEAAFARIDRMYGDLERRVAQIGQQLAAAFAEKEQRTRENEQLAVNREQLGAVREQALKEAAQWAGEAAALRVQLAEAEQSLKALRAETDSMRDTRSERSTSSARLAAELTHIEESCVSDLGIEANLLRAETELPRIEGEALSNEDEACREMKKKLEAMGPVNMMALEEYKETAQRHEFLETQRKDLLDSIENTQATIKEIDEISRTKFDEAFARINENFSATFGRLFGGGQAFMRLTDQENTADSGIDIVAQPPGKKLQNVFLLSGGEKALTALSLLMGIFQYQPSPFCVLDEVDAPLDETNVGRLADMLRSMAEDTQFVMVTHSKRMMTAADLIYGVTMQEPGVSKVVSVRLGGQERTPDRTLVRASA
ncbi:chromosome segregation protein SMC [Paracidobacterium acidisoli]|uniref:Chromosome partition protein Smc n=1 Tax=Paracidobacterium acidisoli TaxID=2303751 RepID=A0A372IU18_9BACT|nr:chromosome segregation protein SMC [Paracidobacterium acidisoli]MBT9329854.1 chromosome segregation protein SMC [Paracidobacterium acidisoli]